MRLILAWLAIGQLRLAGFDMARSDMLRRMADEAMDRAEARLSLCRSLADRAHLTRT